MPSSTRIESIRRRSRRRKAKCTSFLLLVAVLSGLIRPGNAEETIAFRPATGHYVCPEEDMVCSIRGCHLYHGCGQFMNNFIHVPHVLTEEDEEVYVSTDANATIALRHGDADEMVCDAGCTCQPLQHNSDESCRVVTSAPSVSSEPSSVPSMIPTPVPSTSVAPTIAPTATRTIAEVIYEVSGDVVHQPGTPQFLALLWMERLDMYYDYYYNTSTTARLLQRYALVTLDYAFHNHPSRDNNQQQLNWTDPYTHDCYWEGVTCAYFHGVPRVREIHWARRGLSGHVPPELSLLPALETLDLAQNHLQGSLDPFYSLRFLKNLYLFDNRFTGRIRNRISQLNRLERLYLGHNQLTGTLPPSGLWQNNSNRPLQWLILHHNRLNGTIPHGMRLGHLRYLDLSHNQFRSTIPSDWPDRLKTLRTLYLDHNQFYGTIPANMPLIGKGWLKQIYLNDNDFQGRFPRWGDYPTVPIWYLTNIDIRNNPRMTYLGTNVCRMSVFDRAEMVELRADCTICNCRRLCDNCDNEE